MVVDPGIQERSEVVEPRNPGEVRGGRTQNPGLVGGDRAMLNVPWEKNGRVFQWQKLWLILCPNLWIHEVEKMLICSYEKSCPNKCGRKSPNSNENIENVPFEFMFLSIT
jgi:hypothetical protein